MKSASTLVFEGLTEITEWSAQTENRNEERHFLAIAHHFVSQMPWIKDVNGFWHGLTLPRLMAIFLYEITPVKPSVPNFHWICVGAKWPYPELGDSPVSSTTNETSMHMPNVYIWTGHPDFEGQDASINPTEALQSYCYVMKDWLDSVHAGNGLDKCYPVEVPEETSLHCYANYLDSKLNYIKENYEGDLLFP